MKAVRFHQHGGPEVLRYEDAPDPQPAEGRAIVRVRACALNHLDLWERRGLDRVKLPLPHISGADVAGEVLGTGQRVMLQPGLRCGACAACRRGDDNQCVRYDVLGLRSDGGYAELISIPLENLIPIPATLDFITAAAFPLTFLTAWHMLVTRGRLREGDVVLVLAGGSGVGQAAIQLARHFGARVFATSAPEKAERTRALGAEQVFDHYSVDFSKEVTVSGTVRGYSWGNPHVMIDLDVKTASGALEKWQVGGPSTSRMEANGWHKESLKLGDAITGSGYQFSDGQKIVRLQKITMPDGKVMLLYGR